MESIIREATRSTPAVRFDAEAGVMEISGESYPENSFEFYAPLVEWVRGFCEELQVPATLDLKVTYLNTSSTRCMLTILDILEDAVADGKSVAVRWRYHSADDRALETGEEFKEDLDLPFEIVSDDEEDE